MKRSIYGLAAKKSAHARARRAAGRETPAEERREMSKTKRMVRVRPVNKGRRAVVPMGKGVC